MGIGSRWKAGTLTAAVIVSLIGGTGGSTVNADGAKAGERIIVSLGDSYSSGEGIEPFYHQELSLEEKLKDQDWLAHRSKEAWSGKLKLPGVKGEMSEHRDENWFFVACSGATTANLEGEQARDCVQLVMDDTLKVKVEKREGDNAPKVDPQLDVFERLGGKKVDYVTLSLGGNDVDFTKVVTEVATGSFLSDYSGLRKKLLDARKKLAADGETRKNLKEAYQKIHGKAGDAKIIVAGYPKLFDQNGKGFWSSRKEAVLVNDAVHDFNLILKDLTEECRREDDKMKIYFVDVENAFNGHEAYSGDPYINKIMLGSRKEDLNCFKKASDYSMHPNKKGSDVYAECVQDMINRLEDEEGKDTTEEKTTEKKEEDTEGQTEGTDTDQGESAEPEKPSTSGEITNLQLDEKQKEMLTDLLPFIYSQGKSPYMEAKSGTEYLLNESDEILSVRSALTWDARSISGGVTENGGENFYKYSAEDVCDMLNLIAKKDVSPDRLASLFKECEAGLKKKHGEIRPGETVIKKGVVLSPQDVGEPFDANIKDVKVTGNGIDVIYFLGGAGEGEPDSEWAAHFLADGNGGLYLWSVSCVGMKHRYQIIEETMSWTDAKKYCESKGGHLATITSKEEQEQIDALNRENRNLWIGGYREDDGTEWKWVTGEAWGYENWNEGEPNNSSDVVANENRIAVWPKKWNDLNEVSSQQSGFICEWD